MLIGIALGTVASFIFSAVLYGVPPIAKLIARSSAPRPGVPVVVQMLLVVLRSLITALLIAGLMVAAGRHGAATGVGLGAALIAMPFMLLMGGVIHEGTPIPVALVHLLDWAVKLVIIGALIGLFV